MKKITTSMKKIALSAVAVIVKMLSTMILGLLFTHDFASYTSYVSRTNEISVGFLLFILFIDLITIAILMHIAKVLFKVSLSIMEYIMFSAIAVLMFWASDVLFIVEIKSGKTIHHILTGILLLDKYVVFLLISIAYILQIHKITGADKARLFLTYENFRFKNLFSQKLFSYSKAFYNTGIALGIYLLFMFYINFLSLYLYTSTVFFFLNAIICTAILFYLLSIALHQLNVIFSIYRNYEKRKYEAPPTVAMPRHKAR